MTQSTSTAHVLTQYTRVTRILTSYAGADVSAKELGRIARSLVDRDLGRALTRVHAWLERRGRVSEAEIRSGLELLETCLEGFEAVDEVTLERLPPTLREVIRALCVIEPPALARTRGVKGRRIRARHEGAPVRRRRRPSQGLRRAAADFDRVLPRRHAESRPM
ncbi:hypothetical protein PPSIR1_18392 [Plesiocystis pacifica SIR-1]|uniref:Uncharacterized protein n=1 Tax=Plesiocystis pacifica SIR-1 TaxID=391625 RepID=A6GKN0_9BACT|nr:hypothetical protein [Plesiocystis pacifica]EDM73573.1 hypothetical protein PPSIR1_18392 [Plesiocystis pacifica SIR-1]